MNLVGSCIVQNISAEFEFQDHSLLSLSPPHKKCGILIIKQNVTKPSVGEAPIVRKYTVVSSYAYAGRRWKSQRMLSSSF